MNKILIHGPAGTGKTKLASVLKSFFGDAHQSCEIVDEWCPVSNWQFPEGQEEVQIYVTNAQVDDDLCDRFSSTIYLSVPVIM